MICIKNGLLHTMEEKEPFNGDILIENGKIAAIGKKLEIPADAQVFDASGLEVYPGFVEAHCHIGLDGYALGYEGHDYCELNDYSTPHLRAIDGINPMDPCFVHAAKAGVTCVGTGPGSADALGGTFVAVKTHGKRVDSKQYKEKLDAAGSDPLKKPAFDLKCEALIPVLEKKIPLKAHAHQANDIFTALRIAKEFDLDITLEHVTEGHLIADELTAEHVPMAVGPTLTHSTKFELQHKSFTTPGVLSKAGGQVSIITDAPVIPIEYLPLCAGLAVKAGMDPYEALKAITINPAKHLGIEDRVGSLAAGKDADLVITDGNPFQVDTQIKAVLIDGEKIL